MQRILLLVFTLTLFLSCSKSEGSGNNISVLGISTSLDSGDGYSDGKYCAEVGYYNPDTGTESTYTLTVQVQDNEVVGINFPGGGYLDGEITDGSLNSSGEASFTLDNGTEYTVEITGDTGDCFDDVVMAERCNGTTKKGTQCKRLTDNSSGYCWQHEDQQ